MSFSTLLVDHGCYLQLFVCIFLCCTRVYVLCLLLHTRSFVPTIRSLCVLCARIGYTKNQQHSPPPPLSQTVLYSYVQLRGDPIYTICCFFFFSAYRDVDSICKSNVIRKRKPIFLTISSDTHGQVCKNCLIVCVCGLPTTFFFQNYTV